MAIPGPSPNWTTFCRSRRASHQGLPSFAILHTMVTVELFTPRRVLFIGCWKR